MEKRARGEEQLRDAVKSFLKEGRPTLELQRRSNAEEAAAVLFLCSRHARRITGINLRIDSESVPAVCP